MVVERSKQELLCFGMGVGEESSRAACKNGPGVFDGDGVELCLFGTKEAGSDIAQFAGNVVKNGTDIKSRVETDVDKGGYAGRILHG